MLKELISTIILTANVVGGKAPTTILSNTEENSIIDIINWDSHDAIKEYNSSEIYREGEEDYPKRKDVQNYWYKEKNNNYISIRDTTYGAARYKQERIDGSWKFLAGIQNNSPTSMLNITEATAYQGLSTTKININYTINVPYTYGEQTNLYKIRTYATQNPGIANFVKNQNWRIVDYPKNSFKKILKEFYYSLEIKAERAVQKTITNEEYQNFIEWTAGINVQPGITNYLISYVEILKSEIKAPGTTSSNPSVWVWNPGSKKITGIILGNVNYEVINIPDLMFSILTMPFAFISQGFNLTLFPGTPYSVNIGNLLLVIIGVALLIWLIKMIIGFAMKK